MYYGYGGGKPGTTKKPGTTPRFFSRPRPPVRFYTVEALCRYVLFHSTPPFSSSSLIREVHCGKSNQSPAVMQKVRGRHDPPQPFELKNFSLCFPRFAPPAPKNSFRPKSRYRPDHRLFHTPAPHVAQTCLQLFSSARSPKESSLVWHTWTSPVQNRDNKCRTPYANQFVQCLSLLLRRTTAQTAQLLAVTPLASNEQGY